MHFELRCTVGWDSTDKWPVCFPHVVKKVDAATETVAWIKELAACLQRLPVCRNPKEPIRIQFWLDQRWKESDLERHRISRVFAVTLDKSAATVAKEFAVASVGIATDFRTWLAENGARQGAQAKHLKAMLDEASDA